MKKYARTGFDFVTESQKKRARKKSVRKKYRPLLGFAHRVHQAQARSSNQGYIIRTARLAWNQTQMEFGYMMGQGLLSEVIVQRWEIGIEDPPGFVLGWSERIVCSIQTSHLLGFSSPLFARDEEYRLCLRPLTCPTAQDALAGFHA